MKTKVRILNRPPDRAISASTIAIHIPRHNDERVPVPILSTTLLLISQDFSNSRRRPAGGMVQRARSRRQSIADGNRAAAAPTSSQTQLWSLITARACFEELLINYEEFRRLPKEQSDLANLTDPARWAVCAGRPEHVEPAAGAEATVWLIQQTICLLNQQIAAFERAFVKERR